jgi:hypothetical protein
VYDVNFDVTVESYVLMVVLEFSCDVPVSLLVL